MTARELSSLTDRERREVLGQQQLAGPAVRRLMAVNRKTIAGLAGQMNIPQRRVREVRESGVRNLAYVKDWIEAITAPGSAS